MAAEAGNEANVQSILNKSVADINRRCGSNGETPLYQAAMEGHDHIIRILLAHSADPEVASVHGGYLPLHVAAERGYVDAVKALLSGGADIRAKATKGWTALHLAAQNGHGEVVARLLEHDVDINAQGGRVGQTPLYNAAFRGHDHIIKLLLDKGADPRKRTTEKLTAADIAAQFGHKSCEKLLRNRMGLSSIFARLTSTSR
jgi:ankyrin repeat protein